ncbi:hypothetical protein GA0115255_115332 [Streptomyces sp. Ncost-T6T-2b]|nr:hypothetical protein GA0115255_115332 [Streptomyces sp. Ncost-T6T-2b]
MGVVWRTPVLRAALRPAFCCRISRKRLSRAANSAAIRALPSVEPSSTITTSIASRVCSATDRRQSSR